jgi:hypothetical protein
MFNRIDESFNDEYNARKNTMNERFLFDVFVRLKIEIILQILLKHL